MAATSRSGCRSKIASGRYEMGETIPGDRGHGPLLQLLQRHVGRVLTRHRDRRRASEFREIKILRQGEGF